MEENVLKNENLNSLSYDDLLGVISSLQDKIIDQKSTIESLKQLLFGRRSERRVEDPENMKPLFDEVEVAASEPEQQKEVQSSSDSSSNPDDKKKKDRGKRKPLSKDLPRERIEFDLNDEDKICKIHNISLVKIGENVSEQLEVIPAKIYVKEHVSFTYKCPCCDDEDMSSNIVQSKIDPKPIPKSFASPSLLAYIATSKYCDALPLYRLESIFKRYGIDLSRTSMARWMINCSDLITPLLNFMREDLLTRKVVGCDESPIQVLNEPGRDAESSSFMWVTVSMEGSPIVLFSYKLNRSAKAAEELLSEYKGTIVCDGLKSYDSFALRYTIELAGCMAHIRRKFYSSEKAAKKANPKAKPIASLALDYIKKLYAIEKEISGKSPDEILNIRHQKSKPIMLEFKKWLDSHKQKVLPKSLVGRAISYALDQWEKMQVFLCNPIVPIDNNRTERAIRPFVIGRNNWICVSRRRHLYEIKQIDESMLLAG